MEEKAKKELQKLVKNKFVKPLDSIKSFEELSEVSHLSLQTLRRFFGKIDKEKKLSVTSLSILCQYVGFYDWADFLQNYNSANPIIMKDKVYIESMSVFFKNGKKYNLDYYKKTLIVDTFNDYVATIYSTKENVEYFYNLYKDNDWACNYIFSWLPNYNLFGNEWFRQILQNNITSTSVESVKLALCNFLFLGNFLSYNEEIIDNLTLEKLKNFYKEYKKESNYMPFHEMRYHSILLIEAKKENDRSVFYKTIQYYLDNLEDSDLRTIHKQELIIFLCNTLVWMKEYEICYELLKKSKSFLKHFSEPNEMENSIHYFGINMAFVKTTFTMVWIANKNNDIEEFELTSSDFDDPTGLLYNDYIKLMYLGSCIIIAKGISKKTTLFSELKVLVSKTNYKRIYSILKDLDPDFIKYNSH